MAFVDSHSVLADLPFLHKPAHGSPVNPSLLAGRAPSALSLAELAVLWEEQAERGWALGRRRWARPGAEEWPEASLSATTCKPMVVRGGKYDKSVT